MEKSTSTNGAASETSDSAICRETAYTVVNVTIINGHIVPRFGKNYIPTSIKRPPPPPLSSPEFEISAPALIR